MVAESFVLVFAIAFFVLFIGPVLWFTWLSLRDERHSDEAEAAVENPDTG